MNAAIDNALLAPDSLPVEFRLLGIKPQYLKPEDIISRHQGLLGNLTDEWETALVVHQIGEDKTKEINWYHPNNPDLRLDSLVKEILSYSDVMDLYKALNARLIIFQKIYWLFQIGIQKTITWYFLLE